MKIRNMLFDDLSNVRKLWKEVGFLLSESDSIDELKRMLKHNQNLCLVMVEEENNNEIIGAVLGGFDGRRGWVHHLAVKQSHRRKGLGKKLMINLVSAFKSMGVIKIKLEILESNEEIIQFYKGIGWKLRNELITMSLDLPRE